MDELNPQQKEAVTNFHGAAMILAGAGTGKTRVVTQRIAYMISCGVEPYHIAAMTFTNKAAREMKERLSALIGKSQARQLSIGTFHNFCLNILRTKTKEAGLADRFSLVGTSDQLDLVRRVLEEKAWSGLYRAEDLHYRIGICKNWLITPEELVNGKRPPQGDLSDTTVLSEVYALYERQLKLNRAIDFDDCIFKVVKLLEKNDEVKKSLQERFQHLLVDEFQDTNYAQFAILEHLAAPKGNICVVGDDDQSIYSWRGAMYETLESFKNTFDNTNVIKLEQNYRCTNIILNAANTVIKHNKKRMDKTLWSATDDKTPITVAGLEDAVEEARWVAGKCIEALGAGYRANELAILYRANAQAKLIEMAMRECSLPYKTFGGQSFFERKEVKDFLSYLRLITNPHDHLALWRIINTPTRGVGLRTQEQIDEYAKATEMSPFDVIRKEDLKEILGRHNKGLAEFSTTVARLSDRSLTNPEDLEKLGQDIIDEFKLVSHIKSLGLNPLARQQKIENLKSLPGWLKKTAEDEASEGSLDCLPLIDRLTMNDAPGGENDKGPKNFISLMTIHAAKGLEFPVVFLVGLEEELLPHKNSTHSPQAIDEERRLFYVGLTRAKTRLHLSYAHFRQTGFQRDIRKPSRFLKEMPDDGLNEASKKQARPVGLFEQKQERKQKTLSKLSKIKENLMSGDWN